MHINRHRGYIVRNTETEQEKDIEELEKGKERMKESRKYERKRCLKWIDL